MGKRKKNKALQARVSDADDDDDRRVPSSTPAITHRDDPPTEQDAQSHHNLEDNWPPGWSGTKKREISPAQWPLNSEQLSRYVKLLKKMGQAKKPTPGSIAKMIGAAGIWDVSHPKWKLEGPKGIAYHFHPDKVTLLVNESRKAGVKINDTFKDELLRLATTAFQGEVTDDVLTEGTDISQSATTIGKRTRPTGRTGRPHERSRVRTSRPCRDSERQRRRYSVEGRTRSLP